MFWLIASIVLFGVFFQRIHSLPVIKNVDTSAKSDPSNVDQIIITRVVFVAAIFSFLLSFSTNDTKPLQQAAQINGEGNVVLFVGMDSSVVPLVNQAVNDYETIFLVSGVTDPETTTKKLAETVQIVDFNENSITAADHIVVNPMFYTSNYVKQAIEIVEKMNTTAATRERSIVFLMDESDDLLSTTIRSACVHIANRLPKFHSFIHQTSSDQKYDHAFVSELMNYMEWKERDAQKIEQNAEEELEQPDIPKPTESVKTAETPKKVTPASTPPQEYTPSSRSRVLSFLLRVFGFALPALATIKLVGELVREHDIEYKKVTESIKQDQNRDDMDLSNLSEREQVKVVEKRLKEQMSMSNTSMSRDQWYSYWMIYASVCILDEYLLPSMFQSVFFVPFAVFLGWCGALPNAQGAIVVYSQLCQPASDLIEKADKAIEMAKVKQVVEDDSDDDVFEDATTPQSSPEESVTPSAPELDTITAPTAPELNSTDTSTPVVSPVAPDSSQ